jgi:hypothetical protein
MQLFKFVCNTLLKKKKLAEKEEEMNSTIFNRGGENIRVFVLLVSHRLNLKKRKVVCVSHVAR